VTVLLDTHAFLWWVTDAPRLTRRARKAIGDSACLLSIASCWEMAIKASLGHLDVPSPFGRFLQQQLEVNGFQLLAVTLEHTAAVRDLPFHHRDPFDRLIAAQAQHEDIALITKDRIFTDYGVKRIW
jgi:PIN domain nuclease of toxin-antitoxin system